MNQAASEKWFKQEIIRFGRELHQRWLICGYAGTPQIAESIAELIRTNDGVLLSHHGAVTVSNKGPEVALLDAYNKMEKIEYSAKIIYLLEAREKVGPLPDEEIANLLDARTKLDMGVKAPRFRDQTVQPT